MSSYVLGLACYFSGFMYKINGTANINAIKAAAEKAWVCTYGLFLEERLEYFRVLKYDIEADRIPRRAQGEDNKPTKPVSCSSVGAPYID
ncbi:hypothetical protein L1987_05795 [Smallanthus sonchifolius]|uniref:Uncharacterized protein n=1 Tax=Smallanthus sonchifolius TaxID=185202 RepID=A0ACB9JWA9_9ASTR|nr:hypothetical protein L1987_05795 [Smallanthus sonchifolius]